MTEHTKPDCGEVSFTEQERTMSAFDRAKLAGYDARYEGKPVDAMGAFAQWIVLARAWREGWGKADEELKLPALPDDDADFTPDLARKIIAKYQELLRIRAQQPPSPVNAELLADRLQRVIDSFDAQRQKYHNNASDPGFNGMQQEAWASLANEKADDLRVLRKLLVQSGIRAQCVPSREAALEAAALDFIAKVDRGEARSRKSYAAFKAALSFTSPECDDDES